VRREVSVIVSSDSQEAAKLAKLLCFFGVVPRFFTAAEFLGCNDWGNSSKIRLFASSHALLEILTELEQQPDGMRRWEECVHSVFIHAGNDVAVLQVLLRKLTGDAAAAVAALEGDGKEFVVADMVDFCGPMSGLRFTASDAIGARVFVFRTSQYETAKLILLDHGAVFLKIRYQNVTVLLSAGTKIIDIETELTSGLFDIRNHVLAALPIVLYIKWAFPDNCWRTPETNACLIIDDPLLSPTYGFVDFRELLFLMRSHKFSTNIAFIPWNWRRSHPQIVQMFTNNPGYYSISIHGCDHTKAEFGSGNKKDLSWKVRQALERMADHESRTGIHHDRVMIFPQGVFSEAAMNVLKRSEFIASINNDTISDDPLPRSITVSDVWGVATMVYSSFPLFTRRYPWEGIENFAFDSLLGKPAIIVIHHDFCGDRCRQLTDFVDRVNALKCRVAWCGLTELVRRTYRYRELSLGSVEVEMYGSELQLENQFNGAKRFVIRKRETDPSSVVGVSAGPRQLSWSSSTDHVEFDLELKPSENAIVKIHFRHLGERGQRRDSLPARARIMLRRRCCEFRDNYLVRYQLGGLDRHNGNRAQI
jgi:hypothetical protein